MASRTCGSGSATSSNARAREPSTGGNSPPDPLRSAVVNAVRTVTVAILWLAIALVVALGVGGIAATMSHAPGTPARAELTWDGDHESEPAIDAATGDLQALSDRVDDLGATARDALTQVSAGDVDALQASITRGTILLDAIDAANTKLTGSLSAIPHAGGDWALDVSASTRQRYEELRKTTALTSGLEADWASFTGRALDAATMTQLLALHDPQTAAAAKEGTAGRYQQALTALDASDATIARARTLRDALAKTTDVATLTSWIDRNAAYDAALRDLYAALIQSKGRVNPAVHKAIDAEKAARAQLPADTRALVVIMSDIEQGGLNQAVISIEQARGALSEALDTQEQIKAGPTEPPDATMAPPVDESASPSPG